MQSQNKHHRKLKNQAPRTYADFKAVSLNVMQANTKITNQYYSVLTDKELQERIQNLGNQLGQEKSQEELFQEFEAFLKWGKSQSC